MPTLLKEPTHDQVDELEPVDPPVDGGGDGGDDGGDEGASDGPWVTVAVYWHSSGAHLAQLHLESQGIESILLDENMAMTLVATAVGGIKLQVRQSDATRAQKLLRPEVVAVGEEPLVCPQCGSNDTVAIRRSSWTLIVAATIATFGLMLIALPWLLAAPARWRRCLACGHGWMPQGAGFPIDRL